MKTKNFKRIIGLMYVIFILAGGSFFYYEYYQLYDHVVVIGQDNKTEKIPLKIVIHHPELGDYIFTDKNSVYRIWHNVNRVMSTDRQYVNFNSKPDKNIGDVTLTGEVYFINGKVDNFTIKDALIYKDKDMVRTYSNPMVDKVKENMLEYFNSLPHIAKLCGEAQPIKVVQRNQVLLENLTLPGRKILENIIEEGTYLSNSEGEEAVGHFKNNPLFYLLIEPSWITNKDDKAYEPIRLNVYGNGIGSISYTYQGKQNIMYFEGNFSALSSYLAQISNDFHGNIKSE